jgi:hypothetical protein
MTHRNKLALPRIPRSMPPRSRSSKPAMRDEFEAMSKEMAQDAAAAARLSWRMATRVGRFGLHVAERATRELMDSLE